MNNYNVAIKFVVAVPSFPYGWLGTNKNGWFGSSTEHRTAHVAVLQVRNPKAAKEAAVRQFQASHPGIKPYHVHPVFCSGTHPPED